MTKHKALLALLVVGALFMGATTAQAYYCEKWSFSWGSGSLTWNGDKYYVDYGGGYMWCVEYNDDCPNNYDEFLEDYTDWRAALSTVDGSKTLYFIDSTYSSNTTEGCKQTGQSGTKEGYGTWCAYDTVNSVFFWGDWDTGGAGNYFDYSPSPPSWDGRWILDGVSSASSYYMSTYGSVGGNRLDAEDPCTSAADD